ncbi:MAG TPA: carboxypeptidase regulatory-like domain-containing protein [Methanoregulaceae archaeon]|nr:MAG: carboxypeptidase regulatory-like domain-containing protein [Methanolinea sp.]HON81597.1 carboxypeptidase regulatory-like domain-containing protein [Methanoregulaceae archaeon]HPD10404.1 carboxypeptidase regulatory-like domain-containing protein [Methanoregulaceae archaeon]HRT15346.1 carboxypeptidase regulatory-like domain-containing protein [Methanoregulaceae archaeon]HRU30996.1 carboxypeptidase regulatory-like domain-containing protein [Methanoregulaceae archaeon]
MQRYGVYLLASLLLIVSCSGSVSGGSVLIHVIATDDNITPVQGAYVYFNDTLAGKTDKEGFFELAFPGTGPAPIQIEKFGYDSWSGSADANATQVTVELQRSKMALLIHVYDADTMEPVEGAGVTIESNGVGNVTTSDSEGTARFFVMAHAAYRIDIEKEQYQPHTLEVEIGNVEKNVQVMLFRQDRFSLVVKDEGSGRPLPGARIFVEGIERGSTDQKGVLTLPLPRGKIYLIRVVREGYQDYNGRQVVEPDTAFLTVPLGKAPYTVFVSVYNEEKEPVEGARILIDNMPAGTTSRYGRAVLSNLTTGTYTLDVHREGYVSVVSPLTVAAQGEDIVIELAYQRVNVTLKAVEGSSKPVTLAKVTINGEEAGYTDAGGILSARLRAGLPTTILAEKEGYNPVTIVHTPDPSSETVPLTIRMDKNYTWLLLVIGGLFVVGILGAVLVLRSRGTGRVKRGRRGL